MRWRYILYTVGVLILFFGGTMVVPLAFDLFRHGSEPVAADQGHGLSPEHYYRRPAGFFWHEKRAKPSANGKAWPLSPWVGRPSACSARCPFIFPMRLLFFCGCVLRVRFRVYHYRGIDSDRHRRR
jgi:hypothetical protein